MAVRRMCLGFTIERGGLLARLSCFAAVTLTLNSGRYRPQHKTLGKASGSGINGVRRACAGFMGRVHWVAADCATRDECANVVAEPTVVTSARLSDVLFCIQDIVRCLLQCVQVSIPLVIYCQAFR